MSAFEKIVSLTKSLLPRGRAFRMPLLGDGDKLVRALAKSETRAFAAAKSVLNSALPDNDEFAAEDASQWEKRLGMITNPGVPLSDRKLAIIRKMNHPGTIPARQHYLYLEGQLQKAGFNVYVYENRFPNYPSGYVTKTPAQFSLTTYPFIKQQHGNSQHGNIKHGGTWGNKIVNHIDEVKDADFDLGSNLRSTFFIGGNPAGSYADVDADRKEEFRQLILLIKPVQTVGFLFINYV